MCCDLELLWGAQRSKVGLCSIFYMDSQAVPDYIKALQNLIQTPAVPSAQVPAVPSAPAAPAYTSFSLSNLTTSLPSVPAAVPAPAAVPSVPVTIPSQVQEPYKMPSMPAMPAPIAPSTTKSGKFRFMMVSTHCQQFTGYSKVSYGLIQQLAKQSSWLELIHYGFQKNPQPMPPTYRPYPPGVDVIDAVALEQQAQPPQGGGPPVQGFAFQQLAETIRKKQPNVVMIYNDLAVVARFIEEIRKSGIPRTFKLWVYCDQVYTSQLQGLIDVLNRDADRIFTFTPYWKQTLKDQGITRPVDVILHGFDQEMFKPVSRDMVRAQLKIPTDAFIYICLNRNQPRKRYDLLIMAFVELIVKNPTKPLFLMCICDKGDKGGWPIFEIYQRELKLRGVNPEQFGNRLMLSSQDMAFRDEDINMFYNVADVGVSAAEGEGWGLCNFEQMGVGIPQVLPDVGGFKEYCNAENSILVKPNERFYLPLVYSPIGGEVSTVNPHALSMAMEEYCMNSSKRKEHGIKARETVLKYTWERAAEPLVRRLTQAKEDLGREDD
jgi:glycosyltransferase involved in cell wall biosynthesis